MILVPTSYYQLHTKFFPHLIMVMKAGVAFLNTSKATDIVWQDALLFKLHQNGISLEIHTLIKEFLSCRKQRVMFNGQHSPRAYCQSWRSSTVNSRNLLCLIWTNDLRNSLSSNAKLFAGGTSLIQLWRTVKVSVKQNK